VNDRGAESGVLLTGVYGSGKSSVAGEIAYLLEQQGEPYALLDLDYLSWAGPDTGDRAAEIELMRQNLAAVTPNYRRIGVRLFVLAYFVRSAAEVQVIKETLGLPLAVARLTVPWPAIEQRLASDVTSGRRDDLREAAASIANEEGADLEDVTIANDRPIGLVAQEVMAFLGWPRPGRGSPPESPWLASPGSGVTRPVRPVSEAHRRLVSQVQRHGDLMHRHYLGRDLVASVRYRSR
jgi:hypothetical protein